MHLWIAALLTGVMGLVLGLLGGGGSILTVPILVYVLGIEAHAAIAFSLVLVGGTALVAALLHNRKARVDWKDGLLFASFGAPMNLLAAYFSRRLSGPLLLLLFGMVMGIAGIAMLRRGEKHQDAPHKHDIRPAIASGAAVGLLTGFLGIGGGFLIVPALVLFLEMPMKLACGTSLPGHCSQQRCGLVRPSSFVAARLDTSARTDSAFARCDLPWGGAVRKV